MILVGKKPIIDEITKAVAQFKKENSCELDYVILTEKEWYRFLKETARPKYNKHQFMLFDVLLVKEGYTPTINGVRYE